MLLVDGLKSVGIEFEGGPLRLRQASGSDIVSLLNTVLDKAIDDSGEFSKIANAFNADSNNNV
jgi:hypothetical protein